MKIFKIIPIYLYISNLSHILLHLVCIYFLKTSFLNKKS